MGGRIDLDELQRLHAQGLSDAVIAERLRCSRPGVTRARKRLGIHPNVCPMRPAGKPPIDPHRVRRLHARGFTDCEIGTELGVSHQAVHQMRQRLGLHANSRGGRPPGKRT